MTKASLCLAILILALPNFVFSKEIVCDFNSWNGAHHKLADEADAAVISWIGSGFQVDPQNSRLKVTYPNGNSSGWSNATKKSTEKFDTYVYYSEVSHNAQTLKLRYGYRVYKNGKCNATMSTRGYSQLSAKGRWK